MIQKKHSGMARKWKKLAAIGRKRIYFTRSNAEGCSSLTLADEGCFVIYSIDRRRFMIPLVYLSSHIFQKLLEMSEEEYGLSRSGPIVMPCDSVLLENILTLIERGVSNSSEKTLLDALSSSCNIQQSAVPLC
ncbi:hypothetical protein ACJRO7_027888 [Eucalyptus globulus]|uniref:Uncharacterized protein n=1 Tax=Eucalyptus globulus TaxID=34317 RepID=A0ABD3JV71_EUCGL